MTNTSTHTDFYFLILLILLSLSGCASKDDKIMRIISSCVEKNCPILNDYQPLENKITALGERGYVVYHIYRLNIEGNNARLVKRFELNKDLEITYFGRQYDTWVREENPAN